MSDFQSEFCRAKEEAKRNLEGSKDLRGYFNIGYSDPWLEWLAQRAKVDADFRTKCRTIFVLQDWGEELAQDPGIDLLRQSLEEDNSEQDDRTLKVIKETLTRAALLSGEMVVFNAVWALRADLSSKTATLPAEIHRLAFPIWASMIKTLCPGDAVRSVCLCGSWAKWPETPWGTFMPGDKEILRWKKWGKNVTVEPRDFASLKFCTIPHPSAWTFSFADFAKNLVH